VGRTQGGVNQCSI